MSDFAEVIGNLASLRTRLYYVERCHAQAMHNLEEAHRECSRLRDELREVRTAYEALMDVINEKQSPETHA